MVFVLVWVKDLLVHMCVHVWGTCWTQERYATVLAHVCGDSPQLFSALLSNTNAEGSHILKIAYTREGKTNPARGRVGNRDNEGNRENLQRTTNAHNQYIE